MNADGRPLIQTPERRAQIADHEAAHAVIHFFLNRDGGCLEPIREVTLRPIGRQVGAVIFHREIGVQGPGMSERRLGPLEDAITVLYAGPEMDRIHALDRPLGRGDLRTIRVLMGHYPGSDEAERSAFLNWLRARARALLLRPDIGHCLRAISAALQTQETLSNETLNTLLMIAESAYFWQTD